MTDIKTDSKRLFKTAMHELVHQLIARNAKEYQTLVDEIIKPILGSKWYETELRKYALQRVLDPERRKQLQKRGKLTAEERTVMEEEFICDTIADLMVDGCDMGVKSLTKYLNQYKAAGQRARDIAARLIRLEEQLGVQMRPYL